MTHHTKDKGDLAVMKVQADLCEQGFIVCVPNTEHAPFDLVVYRDGEFWKVQVKYADAKRGVMQVHLTRSWASKRGNHVHAYGEGDFDVLSVYCPVTKLCYHLPWNSFPCRSSVSLRLNIPGHRVTKNMRMADEFIIFDPVAQRTEQTVSTRKAASLSLAGVPIAIAI